MSDMSQMLSFRITDQLRREFDRLCRRQKRPASEVARDAIRRYLVAEELRGLREKLRPHAEARGILTDEDVFRMVS